MFKKILVANRGEIAVRIIRACKELGVKTVTVYSEADRDSLHVKLADEAYCIGPAAAQRSYLHIPNIMSVALLSGADAVHPGYGFLAENPQFADVCRSHNIKFIGPSPEAIEKMGDKAVARRTVQAAGVPVLPGSEGVVRDPDQAVEIAEAVGYPVIIKAAAGGGGRGMRVAADREALLRCFKTAVAEAESAFGSGDVYIEKYLIDPRHIEVQVLADEYGNVVHFGERDCSIQRRHQKVIEECPSPAIKDGLRKKLGADAVKAAKAVGYTNAGTVEFLVHGHGRHYFLEMNTRIQVEHPVTELVYGVDLVQSQIKIAAGEILGVDQTAIEPSGHAIECRITAEDPWKGFMPMPGRITRFEVPGGLGVRVDTAAYTGYTIPPHYDSLIAKLIAWAPDRDQAIARMKRALEEFVIEGVPTTIEFHKRILDHPDYRKARIYANQDILAMLSAGSGA